MKKILPLIAALALCAGQAMADDVTVTFDFTSAEELSTLGYTINDVTKEADMTTVSKGGVTVTNDNATASTNTRFYTATNGKVDLRIYKNAVLTVAAPEGKFIKEMTWTTQNSVAFSVSEGTATGSAWTGEANPVVLTCTSNSRINVLTVKYGDADAPEPPYSGKTAEFDFTSSDQITAWGIEIPENGAGTSVNEKTVTISDASMSFADGEASNPCRIWAASGGSAGALNLRTYNGSSMTFSVATGYIIDKMEFVTGNNNLTSSDNTWSSGSLSATQVWTPTENVNSVTLTVGATLQINKVTFYYKADTATQAIHTFRSNSLVSDALYNLQGQRISAAQGKGIVISDGKKYVVK
ncbi:MAG: hypothetical protein IJ551_00010 [Prevotella sp.]|nr:hypothetical protein [Prevotella sp.]